MAVPVLHLIDSLDAGGAEQVAVNLVNLLPRDRFETHLCTTRRDGALSERVCPHVGRLSLSRKQRIDVGALRRLRRYIRDHGIQLLHAHSSSILTAVLAGLMPPYPSVIWHDHYGRPIDTRGAMPFRVLGRRVAAVISVNQALAAWAREAMHLLAEQVHYVPNFAFLPAGTWETEELPGSSGRRIVNVANLRPQKDHLTLLAAFEQVLRCIPDAHLLLVGGNTTSEHGIRVQDAIRRRGLTASISVLGIRRDIPAILSRCDVGVLSSVSEGLPLSLLEYGAAGLPVACTDVGQCGEVLEEGRAGLLVPFANADALAQALLNLLNSPALREQLGGRLKHRVEQHYSPEAVIGCLCEIYDTVLR